MSQYLMNTYAQLPVSFTQGKGAWLWDTENNAYLDALSGIAVCNLGHANPKLQKIIAEQAGLLLHTSNLYHIPYQEALAQRLCKISGMERVFFANSGTEANEAAIKLARLYGNNQHIANPTIIVAERSFHGRTLGALSATGNPKVQQGFAPLLPGFIHVPYNDISAIEKIAISHDNIVAVMLEPIQGEGGVWIPDNDYLPKIREICDKYHWLFILDEIQTGMGRTGQWFGFQRTNIEPDIMTLAKGLGNGIPIGACLAKNQAANLFAPGNHGSTFGGNPFACRVAQHVLEIIEEENLMANASHWGNYILQAFQEKLGNTKGIVDIRGRGLMIGIELAIPCGELVKQALTEHILINVTNQNIIRLLPPLIIQEHEAKQIVHKVSQLVLSFLHSHLEVTEQLQHGS